MKNTYSIAIYPSADVMDIVKGFKCLLAKTLGWFHSRNSSEHITIIEFEANRQELFIIRTFLKDFVPQSHRFILA